MSDERDVLEHLHEQLTEAREQAARWIDRAQALRDLSLAADAAAGTLNQTYLTIDQLWASPADEHERAQLQALIDRAIPTQEISHA